MSSLLIPHIDENLLRKLEAIAATHRRSIEVEALELLRAAIEPHDTSPREHIADLALRLFGKDQGVELVIPQRSDGPQRTPPDFSDDAYGKAEPT